MELYSTLHNLFALTEYYPSLEKSSRDLKRFQLLKYTIIFVIFMIIFCHISSFTPLVIQGGSLPSHIIVSCGMKLLRMFRKALLKVSTFWFISVLANALSQLKLVTAHLTRSVLAKISQKWIKNLYSILDKNNLMMTIQMQKRMNIRFNC